MKQKLQRGYRIDWEIKWTISEYNSYNIIDNSKISTEGKIDLFERRLKTKKITGCFVTRAKHLIYTWRKR